MRPNALNFICAHPFALCAGLGALALDAVAVAELASASPIPWADLELAILLPALVTCFATTALGMVLGLLVGSPWIIPLCRRINGAPLRVGDTVHILSGRHRGRTASVYAMTVGQGGEPLARLTLGAGPKAESTDLFAAHSVLRLPRTEQTP